MGIRCTELSNNERMNLARKVMERTLKDQLTVLQELNIELVKTGADPRSVNRVVAMFNDVRALKEEFTTFYVMATTELTDD